MEKHKGLRSEVGKQSSQGAAQSQICQELMPQMI